MHEAQRLEGSVMAPGHFLIRRLSGLSRRAEVSARRPRLAKRASLLRDPLFWACVLVWAWCFQVDKLFQ